MMYILVNIVNYIMCYRKCIFMPQPRFSSQRSEEKMDRRFLMINEESRCLIFTPHRIRGTHKYGESAITHFTLPPCFMVAMSLENLWYMALPCTFFTGILKVQIFSGSNSGTEKDITLPEIPELISQSDCSCYSQIKVKYVQWRIR